MDDMEDMGSKDKILPSNIPNNNLGNMPSMVTSLDTRTDPIRNSNKASRILFLHQNRILPPIPE